ncbi:hypothetical protein Q3G72_026584 [Acer saccharum]|nr:hypothetical protein Q3G72_026584 [Acer saccharum]
MWWSLLSAVTSSVLAEASRASAVFSEPRVSNMLIGGCLTRTGREVTTGITFVNFHDFGHLGRSRGTLTVDN